MLKKRTRSIDDILAPMANIVTELRTLATKEVDNVLMNQAKIEELEADSDTSRMNAERANNLAAKYQNLTQ